MDVIFRPLNPVKTGDFLVGVLEQVAVVDSDTVNRLRNGSVVALAPVAASDERLHDFVHGGLLERTELSSLSTTMVEPVANSAACLAHELFRFQGLDCLIHDPLRKIEEVKTQDGEPLLIEGSLFYWNRNCLQSVASCEHAIRRNTVSWHFLLLVGAYPAEVRHTFKSVVQGAKCIVVGAYDGESYLIWRPE